VVTKKCVRVAPLKLPLLDDRELRHAIDLKPQYGPVHIWYSHCLRGVGGEFPIVPQPLVKELAFLQFSRIRIFRTGAPWHSIDTSCRLAAIPDLAMAKDLRDVLTSLF
jgi:hypothetical protein